MTEEQKAVCSVAKFYSIDPDVVEYQWYYLDYLNRLEYMMQQNALEFVAHEKAEADAR